MLFLYLPVQPIKVNVNSFFIIFSIPYQLKMLNICSWDLEEFLEVRQTEGKNFLQLFLLTLFVVLMNY